ncbi:outer membrane lipid asymmetry maintenance protein MlaD [Nevskia soli]|uniref:outer membrane lipid asymmetry maintenance protein MlaD n=1 Tax=Nevskia soli TaxID=418856 RepID=UPI0004A75CF6|nr:outer membrane lipid asymmetry maintenance protein MlaD [Nevskia soli]
MQSRTLEILVGFFVCLGVAAIFLLTFRVASLDTVGTGSNNYRITAKFDTIGGLAIGASVRMAGVKIGRVKGISIDPTSFQAVTTLEIDGRQSNIPEDSTAKILTSGLLGEQYVGLEPGGDDKTLRNGDEIKFTQSAFVLENLIGQFLTSMTQKDNNQGSSQPQNAAQPAPTPAPKSK